MSALWGLLFWWGDLHAAFGAGGGGGAVVVAAGFAVAVFFAEPLAAVSADGAVAEG